ncbi:uncharacterized protein LOC141908875 isoform X2 [Tubulanus polymorphus]|uniref:uncharacterized protein LOC141908875 isoform X2 n=1 Tax=Tubulanus polymorphus TaxID=672921 RepID=UPI003DA2C01A
MTEGKADDLACQNPSCMQRGCEAVKVCHHFDCQSIVDHSPLLLCYNCDRALHATTKEHLRFSLNRDDGLTNGNDKPRSPGGASSSSDSSDDSSNTLLHRSIDANMTTLRENGVDENGDDDDDDVLGQTHVINLSDEEESEEKRKEEVIVAEKEAPVTERWFQLRRRKDTSKESCDNIKHLIAKHLDGKTENPKLRRTNAVRNRKSTSNLCMEYFMLKFDLLDCPDIEVVAASLNHSLRDALIPVFEKRNLNLNEVNIFLEASNTALPLDIDTFPLGGHQLHVRLQEKDGDGHTNSVLNRSFKVRSTSKDKAEKKQSTHQRPKKSASDERDERQRTTQNRLSTIFNPFGKEKEDETRVETQALYDRLQYYVHNGLPTMPESHKLPTQSRFDMTVFTLEEHWTEFVANHEDLDKRQRNQQEAIWELLKSELIYIRGIKVILDIFLCCLLDLQAQKILTEVDTEKLFSNITEIIDVNYGFWEDHMVLCVQRARETNSLLRPIHMKNGFLRFNELFEPYVKYCIDQEASVIYLRELCRDNEVFKAFVSWAEHQKQCKRLKLQDLLVKPMQRITKYSLLLNAILKKTLDVDDRDDLQDMIQVVDRFVGHINSTLRTQHEKDRLQAIIDRIESYDVVETLNEECNKILSEYNHLDLLGPMPFCLPQQPRHLMCEGSLRFKDGISKSVDAYCFLFTDMLLITKPSKRGDKMKVIKPPVRVDRALIHELKDGGGFLVICVSEYKVAIAAYTFQGQGDQSKIWLEKIKKAQTLYAEAREAAQNDGELEIIYDPDDDTLSYTTASLLGPPSSLKPSISHENLSLRRNSSSESDFGQFYNISRARSTECIYGQRHATTGGSGSDDGGGKGDRRTDSLPPKSHIFNQTISDDELETRSLDGYNINQRATSPKSHRARIRSATYTLHVDSDGNVQAVPKRDSEESNGSSGGVLAPPEVSITGCSPPTSPSPVRRRILTMQNRKSAHKPIKVNVNRSDSISSSGTNSPTGYNNNNNHRQSSSQSPNASDNPELENVFFPSSEETNPRGNKQQSHRRLRDKRYHTADSIEHLHKMKDRDSAIHKRLSWNLGNTTCSKDTGRQTKSADNSVDKAMSTDSLRSFVSSSGVSSSGSLHQNPEYDVTTQVMTGDSKPEIYSSQSCIMVNPAAGSGNTLLNSRGQPVVEIKFKVSNSDVNNSNDGRHERANSEIIQTQQTSLDPSASIHERAHSTSSLHTGSLDSVTEKHLRPCSADLHRVKPVISAADDANQSSVKSRSLSDLNQTVGKSKMQDGIVSIEIPTSPKRQYQKLTKSQMMRLKKEILLADTNSEASEV